MAIISTELENVKAQFVQDSFRQGDAVLEYRLFSPSLKEGETCPLVLYLHEAEGQDDASGYVFALEAWQEKHPCYVLAVEVNEKMLQPDTEKIKLLVSVLMQFSMQQKLAVNPNRVYVTGTSTGGTLIWKLISEYTTIFAAAMPICGAGAPFEIQKAFCVPVWAFHAEDDPVVPAHDYLAKPYDNLAGTGRLINALRCAGNPDVHYTEYPAGWMEQRGLHPHAAGAVAYEDEAAKEWLFAQDRSKHYEIRQIVPGFYWIEDHNWDSIYLIEGQDKALVVDTGLAENDFIGMIKSLTRLPFEVAITHNHGDHMLHLDKFDRYYMSEKDVWMFESFEMKAMHRGRDYSRCELMPIKDGDIIDLGGGYEVEVFDIGGHTPGSVAFLDRKRKIMMTGDAFGVWMQVPGATTLSVYQANLEHFLERISAPEYEGICMFGGHNKQSGGYFPFGDRYIPNDAKRIKDMITLCKKLIAGEIKGEPFTMRSFGKEAFMANYGQASIVYNEQVRK